MTYTQKSVASLMADLFQGNITLTLSRYTRYFVQWENAKCNQYYDLNPSPKPI